MCRRRRMRAAVIALVGALLLLAVIPTAEAGKRRFHHGSRVVVGFGFGWWGYPYYPRYYPGYYPWYYPGYPPYYYGPPRVVIQEPSVYVQQAPTTGPLEPGYWYYCQSVGAYYPTAPSCPEAWVRVPPRTE